MLDQEVEFAVAQIDAASDLELVDEGGVAATYGQAVFRVRGVGVAADDDVDSLAARDFGAVGHRADADLGPLEVAEDGDRLVGCRLGLADGLDGAHP